MVVPAPDQPWGPVPLCREPQRNRTESEGIGHDAGNTGPGSPRRRRLRPGGPDGRPQAPRCTATPGSARPRGSPGTARAPRSGRPAPRSAVLSWAGPASGSATCPTCSRCTGWGTTPNARCCSAWPGRPTRSAGGTPTARCCPRGSSPTSGWSRQRASSAVMTSSSSRGCLRHPGYAHAVARLATASRRPGAEQLVALRMRRQQVLHRESPPHLWVVIDETALRRPIGGRAVMLAQVDHLIRMSRRSPHHGPGHAVQRGRARRRGQAR